MDRLFVIDDWCSSLNCEGFTVMQGNPFDAVGMNRGEFRTLREAREFVHKEGTMADPSNVYTYRVRLARRHGTHYVAALFPIQEPMPEPFKQHGLYACRGFDAYEQHFNRSFIRKRDALSFLSSMRFGVCGVARY